MKDKNENQKEFGTASFALAVFLYSKGEQVVGMSAIGGTEKKEFAFRDTPQLQKLINTYKFGQKDDPEMIISVRDYEQARDKLLELLKG